MKDILKKVSVKEREQNIKKMEIKYMKEIGKMVNGMEKG